ncbi:dTDP-4-dehydrorhamnose 3,5-epimerase [Aquidulcibacter sp.]|uniref:dTDP-4-dehydrorhamnose 3,5-epimerase n=1 Tax=Aquidulcibacter sp. TaxID=2052990 RepID=UPI0025C31507|nr:dTDP-4-dehydrorhamnose 3,5-epimerase [Aquidulcibacter sp.]MCA3695832.1 dTDP-4-dehydrorhamnose 3,5-epimerase [Aquidulcibacter sp.]
MKIEPTSLNGPAVIMPTRFGDHRGFFSQTFVAQTLYDAGIADQWMQDNHSFSAERGVVRGLHWQSPPFAQAKLVRVTRGTIYDVIVDIRRGSPTYGQHIGVELSAENWQQLYVPIGFAHGFCTLTDETEVVYKVSAGYAPAHEGGLFWADPDLQIEWPVTKEQAILSERDLKWDSFSLLDSPFQWTGS